MLVRQNYLVEADRTSDTLQGRQNPLMYHHTAMTVHVPFVTAQDVQSGKVKKR